MARIAAGFLKGLGLKIPRQVRATEGKVRQAIFNILGASVEGARVLDGFAGSGALGVEALSRGAREVLFLEADPVCVRVIGENVDRIPAETIPGRWRVVPGDVLRQLQRLAGQQDAFDVILLDPPYDAPHLGKKSLNTVAGCAILAPSGILCLEHARRNPPPPTAGALTLMKQHRYGETVLSFYNSHKAEAHASSLPGDI